MIKLKIDNKKKLFLIKRLEIQKYLRKKMNIKI
jgi:hypothetical protein